MEPNQYQIYSQHTVTAKLQPGYRALALKIQEAGLYQSDVAKRLQDAIRDKFKGSDLWAYYLDHSGDGETGDVIYCAQGDTLKAAYQISSSGETATCKIDFENAVDVVPKVTYQEEDDVAEAKKPASKDLKLCESAVSTEAIVLKEAKADYEIKLIAPGKGSSAFYPAEVLRRDGPNVFKSGTHVYLNHATAVEEAQRPEGDVRNLAGVLTTTAVYEESHAKGPGLYARMKVFADHAQLVEEKAPHVGMSIRASGVAESNKTKMGVPVLKELTSAESVDVVTRAGAGGMILTESATGQTSQEVSEMDAAEITKLQETVAAQALVNKQLLERAIRSDAREEAARLLEAVTLPAQAKARVIARVLESAPPTKDGALDNAKLKEAVDAAAKAEGEYLASIIPSGNVIGMGQRPVPQIDATEAARRTQLAKDEEENGIAIFESLGMPKEAATFAVKGRAA